MIRRGQVDSDGWSFEENVVFENALVEFGTASPAFCEHVAIRLPWRSVSDVKRHFQETERGVTLIDDVPDSDERTESDEEVKALIALERNRGGNRRPRRRRHGNNNYNYHYRSGAAPNLGPPPPPPAGGGGGGGLSEDMNVGHGIN